MTFAEVIGQDKTKALLAQLMQSGRLPHALLLSGSPGCGHLPLALALAQYILCEDRGELDACGRCRHCLRAARWIHPDLHFSFPTVGTNVVSDTLLPQWRQALTDNPYLGINDWLQQISAENKQGNINKEECLNIIRKLSLKTFESPYKVLILWLPEYLGKEGNRLLKLIEEPPENTVFILVTERPELILNTILSRCQLVQVPPLDDEAVAEGLRALGHQDAAAIEMAVQLANGNFNEAQALIQREENDQTTRFLEWLRLAYRGKGGALADWVENFAQIGRENQKHFLRYALHFLRELTLLKVSGDGRVRLRPGELEAAQGLLQVLEMDQIELLVQLINDTTYYVERNANPKILFLDASIQMSHIFMRRSSALQPPARQSLEQRSTAT